MSEIPVSRRQFGRLVFGGVGAAATVAVAGCAAPAIPPAAEIIVIILTWIGLFAATGFLVLKANEQYWKVESARLDVEKKQLQLDGIRDGKRVQGIQPLDDEQLAAVIKHKQVRIEFEDGQAVKLPVTE